MAKNRFETEVETYLGDDLPEEIINSDLILCLCNFSDKQILLEKLKKSMTQSMRQNQLKAWYEKSADLEKEQEPEVKKPVMSSSLIKKLI